MRRPGNCRGIRRQYAGDCQIISAGNLAQGVAIAVNCAAVKASVGVVLSVRTIDVSFPAAACVCSAARLATTLAAVSETVSDVTCAVPATVDAFAASTPEIDKLYALVILPSAVVSAANCAAVNASVGVVLFVRIIDVSFPAAACVCRAARLATTFAAVSETAKLICTGDLTQRRCISRQLRCCQCKRRCRAVR